MDTITFEVEGVVIQLSSDGLMRLWRGLADREPDIELPIQRLQQALQTAGMLRRPDPERR